MAGQPSTAELRDQIGLSQFQRAGVGRPVSHFYSPRNRDTRPNANILCQPGPRLIAGLMVFRYFHQSVGSVAGNIRRAFAVPLTRKGTWLRTSIGIATSPVAYRHEETSLAGDFILTVSVGPQTKPDPKSCHITRGRTSGAGEVVMTRPVKAEVRGN